MIYQFQFSRKYPRAVQQAAPGPDVAPRLHFVALKGIPHRIIVGTLYELE